MPILDRFGGRLRSGGRLIDVPQVETMALRARSPYLLNPLGSALLPGVTPGTEQAWAPGMVQPFPTTAADLLYSMGAVGAGNVTGIYLCDTASPLVDSLGLGPNWAAAGFGELTGRECVGLPTTAFNAKDGIEFVSSLLPSAFRSADATFMAPNGGVASWLMVMRQNERGAVNLDRLICYEDAAAAGAKRWVWYFFNPGGGMELRAYVNGTIGLGVVFQQDSAWHCIVGWVDDVTSTAFWHSDIATPGAPMAYAGAPTFAANDFFSLGSPGVGTGCLPMQVAYVACFDFVVTPAMRQSFFRAFQSASLGHPNTYTRAGCLCVPMTLTRVACYDDNQLAVGRDGNFSSDGNSRRVGIVIEDGQTFEPIGSDDLVNTNGVVGTTDVVTDGPSQMNDAVRVTQTNAWGGLGNYAYSPIAGVAIAGASNIPWWVKGRYKQATVGTTARGGLVFSGDGGGPEKFDILNDAASPVNYTPWSGGATPVGAAHTAVYVVYGANAAGDDCDHAELALIKNRATDVLGWCRAGIAAAVATATPTLTTVNTGNRWYNPARGTLEILLANFQLTNGATFLQFGAAASAGSLTLDYSGGQLRLRIWDATPALAVTILCGALDATEWRVRVSWDARQPVRGITGAYAAVERINAGASPTLLGAWMGPAWTPPTADVTPLYRGTDAAGANAARCFMAEM